MNLAIRGYLFYNLKYIINLSPYITNTTSNMQGKIKRQTKICAAAPNSWVLNWDKKSKLKLLVISLLDKNLSNKSPNPLLLL